MLNIGKEDKTYGQWESLEKKTKEDRKNAITYNPRKIIHKEQKKNI